MRKLLLAIFLVLILCGRVFPAAERPETLACCYDPDNDYFVNTSNLFADDGNYAKGIVTGAYTVVWWNNLNIPYQGKPIGVVIKLEHIDSDQCIWEKSPPAQSVQITFDGGTTWSTAKTFSASSFLTVVTLGNSADLWGLNPPASIKFNDAYDTGFSVGASFKVMLTANLVGTAVCNDTYSEEIWIDYASAIIYYKMPDSPYIYTAETSGTITGGK